MNSLRMLRASGWLGDPAARPLPWRDGIRRTAGSMLEGERGGAGAAIAGEAAPADWQQHATWSVLVAVNKVTPAHATAHKVAVQDETMVKGARALAGRVRLVDPIGQHAAALTPALLREELLQLKPIDPQAFAAPVLSDDCRVLLTALSVEMQRRCAYLLDQHPCDRLVLERVAAHFHTIVSIQQIVPHLDKTVAAMSATIMAKLQAWAQCALNRGDVRTDAGLAMRRAANAALANLREATEVLQETFVLQGGAAVPPPHVHADVPGSPQLPTPVALFDACRTEVLRAETTEQAEVTLRLEAEWAWIEQLFTAAHEALREDARLEGQVSSLPVLAKWLQRELALPLPVPAPGVVCLDESSLDVSAVQRGLGERLSGFFRAVNDAERLRLVLAPLELGDVQLPPLVQRRDQWIQRINADVARLRRETIRCAVRHEMHQAAESIQHFFADPLIAAELEHDFDMCATLLTCESLAGLADVMGKPDVSCIVSLEHWNQVGLSQELFAAIHSDLVDVSAPVIAHVGAAAVSALEKQMDNLLHGMRSHFAQSTNSRRPLPLKPVGPIPLAEWGRVFALPDDMVHTALAIDARLRSPSSSPRVAALSSMFDRSLQCLCDELRPVIEREVEVGNVEKSRTMLIDYFVTAGRSCFVEQAPQQRIRDKLGYLKKRDVNVYRSVQVSASKAIHAALSSEQLVDHLRGGHHAKAKQMLIGAANVTRAFAKHILFELKPFYAAANKQLAEQFDRVRSVLGNIQKGAADFSLKDVELYRDAVQELQHVQRSGPDARELQFAPLDELISLVSGELSRLAKRVAACGWCRVAASAARAEYNLQHLAFELVKLHSVMSALTADTSVFEARIDAEFVRAQPAILPPGLFHELGVHMKALVHSSPQFGVSASKLLAALPVFEAICVDQFNAKASGRKFIRALITEAERIGKSSHSMDAVLLLEADKQCMTVYEQCIKPIVERDQQALEAAIVRIPAEMHRLAIHLRPHYLRLGASPTERLHSSQLLGLLFGLWSLLSSKSFFSGEKSTFLQPHSTQRLAIWRLIGIGGRRDMDHRRHLAEIGTGQGKSVCLGITATFFALLDVTVECVCFSEYLSGRDHAAFKQLFEHAGVARRIRYSTIKRMSEKVMTQYLGDVRESARAVLQRQEREGVPNADLSQHAGSGAVLDALASGRPRERTLLLIDEVDVFFGSTFFGKRTHPVVTLREPETRALVRHVYEQRGPQLTARSVLKHAVARAVLHRFPLLEDIMPGEIDRMVHDSKQFPRGAKSTFQCVVESNRVGIPDAATGNIDFNMMMGYCTAFAYLHYSGDEFRGSKTYIVPDEAELMIGVHFPCGGLLYSEMPRLFELMLGVAGTLSCLSPFEDSILATYQLDAKCHTFVPPLFQRAATSMLPLQVHGGEPEYFDAIRREVLDMRNADRACLVCFETVERLHAFADYLATHPIQGASPHVLNDELVSEAQRTLVIAQAVRCGAVTLLTRTYGRGCDFVCHDTRLVQQGGVNVLQTFFSELPSEEVQIRGRTCRQDNPGSYRLILLLEDLRGPVGITSLAELTEATPELHMKRLDKQRMKMLGEEKLASVQAILEKNRITHNNTIAFMRACRQQDDATAARLFKEFSK